MHNATNTYILGIETSCDETAAAILDANLSIKANTVSSQIDLHRVTHGVVPEVAARAHTERILPVVDACLEQARLQLSDLSAIAVTRGPGLITSLLVGLETAKALAFAAQIPVLGINHIEGHVLSGLLSASGARSATKRGTVTFECNKLPLIVLTVSGGHTELFLVNRPGELKLLGRTRDDAAGEAFDKVATLLDLPYPGGPAISKAAEHGNAERFAFPRPMLGMATYDLSFSGLKTAVAREIAGWSKQQIARARPDIAASFEQAVVDTLLGKIERAVTQYRARSFWIVGGVAANVRLRAQARLLARRKKIELRVPSFALCTDNAVMIAAVGMLRLTRGERDRLIELRADPALDLVASA